MEVINPEDQEKYWYVFNMHIKWYNEHYFTDEQEARTFAKLHNILYVEAPVVPAS